MAATVSALRFACVVASRVWDPIVSYGLSLKPNSFEDRHETRSFP